MIQIWHKSPLYTIGRFYVDALTRSCYSRLVVKGKDNIPSPSDSVVYIAPNHCNTLMDALVVLQADRMPTSYGTRGNIFGNPIIANMLRFLRMVPIYRREREGVHAVARNADSFNEAMIAATHGIPFVLFPEGTHRPKHSLLPLKKGIMRLAIQTAESSEKPVYVVPAGIDLSDYFSPLPCCTLSFGEPIRVTPETNILEAMQTLRERMEGLITYFPDDENYDSAWQSYLAAHPTKKHWWEYPLALLCLPAFLVCGLISLPFWLSSLILISKSKDKCWSNTIRFGTLFALMPIVTLAVGIPAFITLPWYTATALLVLLWVSPNLTRRMYNLYRKLIHTL